MGALRGQSDEVLEELVRTIMEADELLALPPLPGRLDEAISSSDEEKIEGIVRRVLKSKPSEEVILKMTRNVLVSLFRSLYTRRGFWRDSLSASNAD